MEQPTFWLIEGKNKNILITSLFTAEPIEKIAFFVSPKAPLIIIDRLETHNTPILGNGHA